jgi:hypothetical protein
MFTLRTGFCTILFFTCVSAFAQTVKVDAAQTRVKNDYADGFEVSLPGTFEEVDDALAKLMKSIGKIKTSESQFIVGEPTIVGRTYTSAVYGATKQVGNIVSAWVGLKKNEWTKGDEEHVLKALEGMVYDFGVTYHRDKIQKQIDESVRASQAVERQLQRLTNQNKSLNSKIEKNKQDKIDLEKALVTNSIDLQTLTKQLEKNRKDQDSVAVAGQQIQKVIDMHRERQRKVN